MNSIKIVKQKILVFFFIKKERGDELIMVLKEEQNGTLPKLFHFVLLKTHHFKKKKHFIFSFSTF
jgi:hypothetical protein